MYDSIKNETKDINKSLRLVTAVSLNVFLAEISNYYKSDNGGQMSSAKKF